MQQYNPTVGDDIYYNILIFVGEDKKLDTIRNQYCNTNTEEPGYILNIGYFIPTATDEVKHHNDCVKNAMECIEYIDAAYDFDVTDENRTDEVKALYHRLRGVLDTIKLNVRPSNLKVSRDADYWDGLFKDFESFSKLGKADVSQFIDFASRFHYRITKHDFKTVLFANDRGVDELLVKHIPVSFHPLTLEELEHEDQNINTFVNETGGYNQLVIGIPTKYGPATEIVETIATEQHVTGYLLFGNGDIRGKLMVEDGVSFLDRKEPAKEDVFSYLDLLGELENYADKFGWIVDDEEDDDDLAYLPALGVEPEYH